MSHSETHRCLHTVLIGIIIVITITIAGFIQVCNSPAIIDTHEHIDTQNLAPVLLAANHAVGIQKTVLLASPTETLTLNGHKSFTGYRQNTDEILQIVKNNPEHFILFCTVNPLDSDAMDYLQQCVKKGGKGLKLYNGHSYYHSIFGITLDAKRMLPIYAYAERNHLPVLFHVNITKYGDELERVLQAYPNLVVSVPHFMVSSITLDKVAAFLDKYPNLYTDISFGSPEFMAAGFRRISKNSGEFGNFINNYNDRILFGADIVLTDAIEKNQNFIEESLTCYRNLLEKRGYECPQVADYYNSDLKDSQARFDACQPKEGDYCQSLQSGLKTKQERADEVAKLNGLHLSPAVLNQIYWVNPNRFLKANQ